MSECDAREWRFYLDDMISFSEKVIACSGGLDQAGFVANGLIYAHRLRSQNGRMLN